MRMPYLKRTICYANKIGANNINIENGLNNTNNTPAVENIILLPRFYHIVYSHYLNTCV